MSTSETYTFGETQNDLLITDAYERIGIMPSLITQDQILSAKRSMNFILSGWINEGFNLWTAKQGMIALYTNQITYDLPEATNDTITCYSRTSQRNLGGTAFSSNGGVAANCFGGSGNCTQNAPDGNISYTWTSQYAIQLVGIQSNATLDYALIFEYSNDGVTWTSVYEPGIQSYPVGKIVWFVVPVAQLGTGFRIRETLGATLNIQQLYFNNAITDTQMSRYSISEYNNQPNKLQLGEPNAFWVDRQINPTITIWPNPQPQFNCLYFTYIKKIQDIGEMTDTPEIPQQFFPALVSALAHSLSVKYEKDLNKANYLEKLAAIEYQKAANENRERVPMRIYGDYLQGYALP